MTHVTTFKISKMSNMCRELKSDRTDATKYVAVQLLQWSENHLPKYAQVKYPCSKDLNII